VVKTTVSQLAKIVPTLVKKIRLRFVRSVRYDSKIWSESRPPLFLPSPPSAEGGPYLARYLDHYEIGGWVFEKNRLLQALKFDKRWLNIQFVWRIVRI
jgi:hypothetical protein